MTDDEPSIEAPKSTQGEQAFPTTFDQYSSLADPNLMIFVAKDVIPPFRFKAGGWELLKSSIGLGPVMRSRIIEKGYFLCRANEDRSGWTELTVGL